MTRYAKNMGYVGIGVQADKGTAVDPSQFIKYQGSPTMTPEMVYEQYNEGGDSPYPGITLKERHNPNGSFELLARPSIAGLLFAALLGADAVAGEAAPYTHTITPSAYDDMPWVTIERSIADVIVERVKDARITEIEISGEPGKPIVLSVSYQGLTSSSETAAQEATYSAEMPFIFWQGTYTADAVNISAEVSEFSITMTNVFDEDEQHNQIVRNEMTLIRREIETSFSYKLDSDNTADYEAVYYATDGSPAEEMYEGSLKIALEYGETTGVRGLEVDIPNIVHTQRVLELDSGSDETTAFECEGHAFYKVDDGFCEVVVKSNDSTTYV